MGRNFDDYPDFQQKAKGVSNYVKHCTLSNALRNEVEIVSFRKGDNVIENGSGRWIYGISVGFNFVESLIYLKIKF